MSAFNELLVKLRTQEAEGHGTDVRLVMLEAIVVEGRLHALDEFTADIAGGSRGLWSALDGRSGVLLRTLARVWEGIDLQEHTTRLREVDDLLRLLVP